MTLIPKQQTKKCFIACSDDRVKQGLCDCVNSFKNQQFTKQTQELCQCEWVLTKEIKKNWCENCKKHITN